MSDEFRESIINSPAIRDMLGRQSHMQKQREQYEEISRSIEESSQELHRQNEEDRWRSQEHLEASQITASRLDDVTRGLRDVSDALQGVHERLDRQGRESKEESRKNRVATWWSFSAGALAAAAAIGMPFILLWVQSGG